MPYITVGKENSGNIDLYYKDWGDGAPVVLIHGWPLTADSFDDAAAALANRGFRAIVPDRRGFGRSDQPWDGYDYDTFADDVAAVILEAGVREPIALVGFSMGGGEVARYFGKYGSAGVRKAVILGGIPPYLLKAADNPEGVPASVFDEVRAGIKADRPAAVMEFLKNFYSVGGLDGTMDAAEQIQFPRRVKTGVV